jgi:MFS family permease
MSPPARQFLVFIVFNVLCWQSLIGTTLVLHARALGIDAAWIGVLSALQPFTMILALAMKPVAERMGSKRLLMSGWTIRNIVIAPIVLTPWVYARWGSTAAAWLLFTTIGLFCLVRAIGAIGWSSWLQEIVPRNERGVYFSFESLITRVVSVAYGVALFLFLRQQPALWRFACVSVVGVAVGLYSVRFLRRVPGGAPHPDAGRAANASYRELTLVLRDGSFRRFVSWASVGVMISAGQALLLTLYLRDFLGMSPGTILLLNACGSAVVALTINRWAHIADRLGSPRTMAAAALMLAAALLALAAAHPHHGTTWLVVPLYMAIMIAEAGFFVAANRGFLHRAKEGLRHGYSAVWIAGTSLSAGITTVAIGFWLNSGTGWMYWVCSAVLGLVMAGVAVACVRMASVAAPPTEYHDQLFDPTRPYLSLLWMCGFVLDPTRPLDDE